MREEKGERRKERGERREERRSIATIKNDRFFGRPYWQYIWSNNAACPDIMFVYCNTWAAELLSEFYLESAMFWQPTPTSVPSSIAALSTSKASIHRQADNKINHYWEEILALLEKAERIGTFLSKTRFKGSTL